MEMKIRQVALDKLVPHPDNANRMSRANLGKLVRNIERSGHYEPLVVRPCPGRRGFYQIINGHHRGEALRALGRRTAAVVVWDVDDEQTDILLGTLNRLTGRDTLDKKVTLLRRLTARIPARKLARLLPQTFGQIERLSATRPSVRTVPRKSAPLGTPIVFFLDELQQQMIEEGLSRAASSQTGTRAARRASALMQIVQWFLAREATNAAR